MTREEFERKIVEKAQKDPAFRSALMADPKGALQAELQSLQAGVTLPASLKVSVVEESPTQIYLRIPAAVSPEMAEAELAAMAGGAGSTGPEVTIAVGLDVTAVVAPGVVVAIAGDPTVMTVTYVA